MNTNDVDSIRAMGRKLLRHFRSFYGQSINHQFLINDDGTIESRILTKWTKDVNENSLRKLVEESSSMKFNRIAVRDHDSIGLVDVSIFFDYSPAEEKEV